MKALIVPDLPEWKRNRAKLMKLLKDNEVLLFPLGWGYRPIYISAYRLGLKSHICTHDNKRYMGVRKG